MSARDDFDRRLAAWITEAGSSSPGVGRFERAMEATARRRPRPRWLAPFGSDWVGTSAARRAAWAWPGLRRELAVAALVALLVAAAIVGAVLVGALLQRPDQLEWRLGGLAYAIDGDIYVVPVEGEPIRIADGIPVNHDHYRDPHWSPDGKHLLYHEAGGPGTSTVHVADAEGHLIASFDGWNATWAPDSWRIATWGAPSNVIYIHSLDGQLLTRVVIPDPRRTTDQRPAWSPDGRSIVLPKHYLTAEGPDGLQPWVFPVDGAAPRPLSKEVKGHGPAFSPDGRSIAIDSEEGLFLTAADGSGAQLLTAPGSGSYRQPLWSPSGDRIAVTNGQLDDTSPESIQIVNVRTRTAETIYTSSGQEVKALDWSPDGNAVLVFQGDPGEGSVWSVPADGSGGVVVAERAAYEGADWRWVNIGPERATPPPATPTPVETPPSMGEVRIGPLDPGTYEVHMGPGGQGFNVRFTVPAGWTWNGSYLSKGGVGRPGGAAILFFQGPVEVYADPCHWAGGASEPPTGLAPADLMDALAAQPLRSAATPVDRYGNSQGGVDIWAGKSVELTVPADIDFARCDGGQYRSWGPENNARSHQGPGQRDLVWAVDTGDNGVEASGLFIIDAASFPGTPADIMSEIEAILESIVAGHWG